MPLDEAQRARLQAQLSAPARFDEPLSRWTSLAMGGPADALVLAHDPQAAKDLQRFARRERLPAQVIERHELELLLVRVHGLRGVLILLDPSAKALDPPAEQSGEARIFLDPPQGSTARELIEDAGLRGIRLRGLRLSTEDGNLIRNEGAATAADALALQRYVTARIEAARGVRLIGALKLLGRR